MSRDQAGVLGLLLLQALLTGVQIADPTTLGISPVVHAWAAILQGVDAVALAFMKRLYPADVPS